MENCRKPRKLQETHRKPPFLLSVHRETQGKVAGNRGNLRKPIGNRRKPLRKPLVFEEVLCENTIFGHTPGSIYITKLKVGSPPPRSGACGSPTTKPARSARILGGGSPIVTTGPAILLGGGHAPGRGRRGLPGRRGDGSSHNGNGIRLPHAFELHAEGKKNRKRDPSPVCWALPASLPLGCPGPLFGGGLMNPRLAPPVWALPLLPPFTA